jgi:hypothetical protein
MILAVAALIAAEITTTPTPPTAAVWAASDLARIPPEERDGLFYVWLPPWASAQWHHATAYAANAAISRSGTIQRPVVVAGGWLQRWDLRQLVPDPNLRPKVAAELSRLIDADPYFRFQPDGILVPEVEAAIADVADASLIETLPIIRADWFIEGSLSSLDGGRYLELRGLADVTPGDGRTEEEEVLARFGVFRDASIELDGDRRVGMFRSEVTAKPRQVLALRGLAGDGWITDDVFDEDSADLARHPIYSLLEPQRRGSEVIVEMPNGLHLFFISDDQGRLLREAPPQLVTDSHVPRPHTARLQGGAISCIRCHASEAGLRSCANDVATLLAGDVGVLVETSVVDSRQAADEIAVRFAGRKFDRSLREGRERYEEAVDQVTGGEMSAGEIGDLLAEIYGRRRYEPVVPLIALRELGFEREQDDPSSELLLRELLAPPDVPAGVAVVEDPTLAALRAGIAVGRADWDRVYALALARSHARRPVQ